MADCTTRLDDSANPCNVEPGAVLHFTFDTPLQEKPVEPTAPVAAAPVAAAPAAAPAADAAPVVPALPAPVDPAALTATTAPAAPTPADLGALAQQGGGGMVGVVLAIVAVAGGGAAWKFYSQRSEQAHELAREKMKMEAQAAGLNGASPPPCVTAHTALEQKVTALTARVEAAEAKADAAAKKGASLSADFDADAMERQVKRLAKAVKELQEDKV